MSKWLPSELIDRLDASFADTARVSRDDRPFVTLSYAQSLDGSITSAPGESLRLSNEHSLTFSHELRSRHDAILVGINTVLADDPRLTVRLVDGDDPAPIIIDSKLRTPTDARVLRERRDSRVIIATAPDACDEKEARLRSAGAHVVRLPVCAQRLVNLRELLRYLRASGVKSLMVEGGGRIITSFLAAKLVDQLIVTVCPVMIGGVRAVNPCAAPVREMPALENVSYFPLEGDLIVMSDLTTSQGASALTENAIARGGSL